MTPRVAFFTDSFHEVNGVALTSRRFAGFAREHFYPFLCVHAGPRTERLKRGTFESLALGHSHASFRLEHDLVFDLLFLKHRRATRLAIERFRPDLVHVTGPSHIGMLGALIAHDLGIPLSASWHTNIHEFASRRLEKALHLLPSRLRSLLTGFAEQRALDLAMQFYRLARLQFAPNPELLHMIASRTGRPTHLMARGIDCTLFTPARRVRRDDGFVIGCVGRLSPEKNVRLLALIDRELRRRGVANYRFLIVGEGGERQWLRQNLHSAELPGVLRGEDLADAYASMDVFVFPSETDTFGNVVLEAAASGVPSIVSNQGGPKFLVRHGVTGFVARDADEFVARIAELRENPELRREMGTASRQSALQCSWDVIFEEIYERYRAAFADRTLYPRHARTSGHPVATPVSL